MHANEVVSIHDSVDETVQCNGEIYITVVLNVDIDPVKQKNGEMMVYVKERKLPPFLSNDNENGIPEVPNLGDVKEPKKIGHGWILAIICVTSEGISIAVGKHDSFDGHVCTKEDL